MAGKSDLTIVTVVVGMLDVNCYLVHSEKSGILHIIDPGSDADRIVAEARKFSPKRTDILLTHAHVDHISAVGEVCRELSVKDVYLHPDDNGLYSSPANHLLPFVPPAKDLPSTVGELAGSDFEAIHTPGHTRGGTCFYFPEAKTLFTGDTIFYESVGRTDLPGGDGATLMSSITEKIFSLPEDVELYPGHGPATSVGHEKASNPYVG